MSKFNREVSMKYTMKDLEKAIVKFCEEQDDIREFGSVEATVSFFVIRYNEEYRKAHVDDEGYKI